MKIYEFFLDQLSSNMLVDFPSSIGGNVRCSPTPAMHVNKNINESDPVELG